MSRFEFLLVLVSIIVALALSDLIVGWGRMLRNRSRVRPYWLHTFWMILFFLILTETWWVLWELESHGAWTYPDFLIVLVAPTLAVLVVETVTPDALGMQEGIADLKSFYYDAAPTFFRLGVAYELALIGENLWFHGVRPVILAVQALSVVLVAVLATSRSRRLHEWLGPAAVVLYVVLSVLRFQL